MRLHILRVPDGAPDSFHGGEQIATETRSDAEAIRLAQGQHKACGGHYIVVDGLVTVFDTRAPNRGAIA